MSFATDLEAFKRKLNLRATVVVRELVVSLGYSMVEKSPWRHWEMWGAKWQRMKPMPPYVPGLFKGSWDYDFSAPPLTRLDSHDQTGSSSRARIAAARTTPPFVQHYIVNNTPYAWDIEYGSAFHNIPDPMPPEGIVRTTVMEYPSLVAAAMAAARRIV